MGGEISRRGKEDIGWLSEGVGLERLLEGEIGVCGGGSITPRWVRSMLASESGVDT